MIFAHLRRAAFESGSLRERSISGTVNEGVSISTSNAKLKINRFLNTNDWRSLIRRAWMHCIESERQPSKKRRIENER